MADEDKKGAGSGKNGEDPPAGSDFKDIGSIGDSDWAGALEQWDDVFDGLDAAKEPPAPGDAADAPAEPEPTESEAAAEPESAEPEDSGAAPAEVEKDALTAALDEASELELPPPEAVVAKKPGDVELGEAEPDGELDFLTGEELELQMESGEALGEMLSSEMDAVEDQLRRAQEAMEQKADEVLGLDFEESTRQVSAADQMRMAGESVLAEDEAAEVEEEAEVTLTVDDEFYDDFSLEDSDDAPAPDLDFGPESEEAAPVEPLSDDVTPERPYMAVPPAAHRDDADATPEPGPEPKAAAESADQPDGDATPVPGDDPVAAALPADAEELFIEAEEPAGEMAGLEHSFEAEEPGGEAPVEPDAGVADEDGRLGSLDAMLGLTTDPAEEVPEKEPKGEGDLASLDALLGIADSRQAPVQAEASAHAESDRVTDFGLDLPEPPAEPQLTNLQELADEEVHPSSLPALEDVEPLPEAPIVDGFPETLEPEPQSAERWEQVAELITGQVEEAPESWVAASLETATGELLEFRLGRDQDAMARYYEASSRGGDHRGCRRALLRCAVGTQDWGVALESLEVLRESESSAEQGAYQALAADLALATMGDADRAAELYTDLADRPSLSLSGLLGLLDVAVFNGDQALLASSLGRLVGLIKSEEVVAPVALEAGHRLESKGNDEAAAVAYERAAAAVGELAIVARDGLARLAMREGQWEAAAERIRSLVTQIDPGEQRTNAAVALARILSRRLDRLNEAVTTADGAARESPGGLAVQIRLARLCQEAGQWEAAVAAWRGASEAARDDHLKAVTQLWAGLLREQFLSDADGALECFREAQERDATLAAASLAMGDVLSRSDDAEVRIEARLARASATAEPTDQAAQQVLAAREMVAAGRGPDGLQLLSSSRASGLDFRGLLRELVQLAIAQGDTDQACAVLLQLGELVEPEAAVAARSRAASMVARGLEEGRQEPYREVYELDAALGHLAWGAQRALRAAGLLQEWDRALVVEAESTADAGRGARIWHHLGTSRRWRGTAPQEALVAFERAAALSSADTAAREAMADLYAAEERWEDCARLLGEAAEAATLSTHAALLQLRRAVCLEQRLDAPDQAAILYQELGEQFPSWPLPIDTLVRLRVWSGDRLKTAEILETQAAHAASAADRVPLLIRASAELDIGGDTEAAARVLGEAARLDQSNPVAQVACDHIEKELGHWSELADRALTIARDAEDAGARLGAYEELARIDRDGRNDFPSAVLGYESIVRLAADHHPSLRELELYYPAEQRFNDLGSISAKIASATEGQERAANAMEWARFRQESNQRDELVEALRMAVRADPGSLFALARLESHALRGGWREELARIHRAVAELYRESPSARAVFLRRAAESHEADGDPERAVEVLTEASGVAPDYLPAAEERLRLELVSERWLGVVDGAEVVAGALRRPEAKAEAYLLAGAVAEERLEDVDRAIASFEAVLELQPENRTAFTRLRKLYEQRQAWPEQARLINARLEVAESGTATCELLWQLAQVERDRLDDASSAKVTIKRLIGMDDNHLEAVRAATELYAADDQWVEMADMLIRQARLEKEPERLTDIFFQLGVLYDEKIPDAKRAVASFSKVVTINQQDVRALERLSAIHVRNEDWKGALAVTGRLVETETDPERRIDHLIALSQILEGGYRDPRRAREALLKAVEVDPRSLKAVGELATFYGRQNDRRSLMVHLDRSVTNVRAQLATDPFGGEAYRSLLKLFEWRRAPDQQACAAGALTTIGDGGDREREILATVGRSRPRWDALKDPELDEILYPTSINSGFRHTMRLLGSSLGKLYRDDLSTYGASRGTRVPKSGHPLRDVANQIGSELGVTGFDLHVVSDRPGVLIVEPYDPPAIIVGSALVEGGSPAELAFIAGRCMKLIQANMVLPAKLKPEQLQALVAGTVRQYQPDFEPTEVPPVELLERTKLVAKAMPRKVKSELMPFALGCAGITDYAQLSRDIAWVSNMSGLLACGDLGAAVAVLLRMAGKIPGKKPLGQVAKGLIEIEQLLLFAVSEEYFELRRRVGLTSGSGPRF